MHSDIFWSLILPHFLNADCIPFMLVSRGICHKHNKKQHEVIGLIKIYCHQLRLSLSHQDCKGNNNLTCFEVFHAIPRHLMRKPVLHLFYKYSILPRTCLNVHGKLLRTVDGRWQWHLNKHDHSTKNISTHLFWSDLTVAIYLEVNKLNCGRHTHSSTQPWTSFFLSGALHLIF